MNQKEIIAALKQEVWEEKYYNLYAHKISCLEVAMEKIRDFERIHKGDQSLQETKEFGLKKLIEYRTEHEKPHTVQLKNNLEALEKEWDEGQKERIRTRIFDNYLNLNDFDNAYEVGMELLTWGHADLWYYMFQLIEAGGVTDDKIEPVQAQFLKHFRDYKDNKYLWHSMCPVYELCPARFPIEIIDEIFEIANSVDVEKENVPWNQIGIFFFEKNNFEKAILAYQKAKENLNLNEENYRNSMAIFEGNIAEAYLELNKYELVLTYSEKALAYDPDNLDAIKYYFYALFNMGNSEQARNYLALMSAKHDIYSTELNELTKLLS